MNLSRPGQPITEWKGNQRMHGPVCQTVNPEDARLWLEDENPRATLIENSTSKLR
jgi:hypothetical protein